MTGPLVRRAACVVGLALACASQASGHVLDQYLEASRIEVAADRVTVEIDLTAGAAIAPQVFFAINTNHDGEISRAEGLAYANRVLQDLELSVDDRRIPLTLVEHVFPSFDDMRAGVGVIRLRASSPARLEPGRHRLRYRNRHDPERGVYLVNALVPSTSGVVLGPPERDRLQQEMSLDVTVASTSQPEPGAGMAENASRLLILVGVVGLFVYRFRHTRNVIG